MNVLEIVTEVESRTKRTDKKSTIAAGINWGQLEIAKTGISIYNAVDSSIATVSGTYQYSLAISDYLQLRYKPYIDYNSSLCGLEEISLDAIVHDYLSGARGVPKRYCISGMSSGYRQIYLGYQIPGAVYTLYIFYTKKPTAVAATDTTTPDLVSAFGYVADEYLISCGEFFVWQSLNQDKNELNEVVNNILVAKNRVDRYKAEIISIDAHNDKPIASPDTFY